MNRFWIGYGVAVCWIFGTQAYLGKEKYVQAIDLLWTDEPWWAWAFLAAVLLIAGVGLDFYGNPSPTKSETK